MCLFREVSTSVLVLGGDMALRRARISGNLGAEEGTSPLAAHLAICEQILAMQIICAPVSGPEAL